MIKYLNLILFLFVTVTMSAQTTISGKVTDSNSGMPIPGVNIKVVGGSTGVATNFDGEYTITVKQNPPFELQASSVGFQSATMAVNKNNQKVNFSLQEGTILDEVVVSASRTPERIFESPVTIERMDLRAIQSTASASYYDGLENLKGVDVNTSSLTFKSVNTRGFATFANTRFMQLVDGMDNSSPALNFPIGNLLGISELDIQGVELLPGASSALYGANAFNGILFMNSKNPFDYQGVSLYVKSGITTQEANGNNEFYDVGVRYAKAFSDKFAAKVSLSFLEGTDWAATDYNQYDDQGAGLPDLTTENPTGPEFNRTNIYGDEVSTELDFDVLAGGAPEGTFGKYTVSRTGYREADLTDYKAKSFKADVGLFYRPTGGDLEISYNGKFGTGNTIYQGANRYYLKNFVIQQHKIEIRDNNFFVRAYMTAEDAGDSYDMFFTGVNMNKDTENNQDNATAWFQKYAGDYIGAIVGGAGMVTHEEAHEIARVSADTALTLQPGTSEFNELFNKTITDGNLNTGSKFVDKSKIYHADANYNFKDKIEFAEIQIGGSARRYSLNSSGTIFTDADGAINYDEFGVYVQGQKKVLDDKLKITGSVRYDKAQNFDGFASPRLSLVYNADDEKKHNVRLSYQTGFRNPTTQDQYIGLDVGQALLVGSAPDNLDKYTSKPLDVSPTGQLFGNPATKELTGRDAYENSFTRTSVEAGAPVKANVDFVKPEKVSAYELGYRGVIDKLVVDFSAYYNNYEDFIGTKTVLTPLYGKADFSDGTYPVPGVGATPKALVALSSGDYQPFQTYTNSTADVSSYGAAIGLTTKVGAGYELGMNYTLAKFDFDQDSDPDYEAGFNTPEHKVKFSIGNQNVVKNIGFNLNVRWSDSYLWQSTFVDAILPARTNVDAQVSFAISKLKSKIKIGGVNIGGKEYFSAPGAGAVGSQYYLSWRTNF